MPGQRREQSALPKISERDFRHQVIDLCKLLGWKHYFTWTSIHSPKGFPDLVLVRERVIFAELKTEKGKVTPNQQEWLDALKQANQEVYLWRPSDFDEIAGILQKSSV
jgi:hypothetical protein